MNKTNQQSYNLHQKVISFLNRQQVDFIDKVGKDALFSKGVKLSRSKIIFCLVELMMELDINGEGLSCLEELKQRIKDKIHPLGPTVSAEPTPREILTYKNKRS